VTSTVDHDTEIAVDRFNTAFNSHDVQAIMALMTDDCVFESTGPAPNGARYEGQKAVAAVWEDLFRNAPSARFDAEEIITTDDRCVVRWRYSFDGGHIRGVDVLRVRDGKVAEKFAYVKG
jgi:ketosteroid isomerase-like protein